MKSTRRLFATILALALLLANSGLTALADTVLNMPAELTIIDEEAFYGSSSLDTVALPDGIKEIRARAFANSSLSEIYLPASLEFIDDTAFDGPEKVHITADKGSKAYFWAVENGYITPSYQTGDLKFGKYEQDDNTENGEEPIDWIILDRSGDKVLLLSLYVLEISDYGSNSKWEDSKVREWLNGSFLETAFSQDERSRIVRTTILPSNSPRYNTDPGNATEDSIFILSLDEVLKYFSDSLAYTRTPYAERIFQEKVKLWSSSDQGHVWLRTPGAKTNIDTTIIYSSSSGYSISYYGDYVTKKHGGIRPAIWVNEGTISEWNNPYATVISQGNSNADNGTVITNDMIGKVLQVNDKVGGWFRMIAPKDGDYKFSVLADTITDDWFRICTYINGNGAGQLRFNKSSEVQTGVVKNVKKGDILTWWDCDNTNRWYTFLQPFKLKITISNSSPVTVTEVVLNKTSETLAIGDTLSLTATIKPENATNKKLTWSSNKTSVATVSDAGVVTAKAAGTATITATSADGSGKQATCVITVPEPCTGDFIISNGVITGYIGVGGEVVVPSKDSNGKAITAIGYAAFMDNTSITKVILPDSIIEIGESAFEGCSNLSNFVMPRTMKYIGRAAFKNCEKLDWRAIF